MTKISNLYTLTNYISANSSGNVVIAAPASGYALDVTGTGRFTGALTGTSITLSNSLNFTSIYGGNINGYDGASLVTMSYSASQHQYYAGGTLKMTLLGNGNLLLGTTTDAGYKLDVNGTGRFAGALSGTSATFSTVLADYAMSISNVQDASQGLLVRATDNDSSLYLLSLQSSNGATSQTWVDRFTVAKNGAATFSSSVTATSGLFNASSAAVSISNASDLWYNVTRGSSFLNIGVDSTGSFYNTSSNHRWLYNSGSNEAMRITSSGNVGIGTTTISTNSLIRELVIGQGITNGVSKLSFRSESNSLTSDISLSSYLGENLMAISTTSNIPMLFVTNSTERMRITSSGNVGIGTTTISQNFAGYTHLDIGNATTGGIVLFSNGSGTNYGYVNGEAGGVNMRATVGILTFNTGATERMRITSGGNMLIATTSDVGGRLQVNGDIRAYGSFFRETGNITVNNGWTNVFTINTASQRTYLLQIIATNSEASLSYRYFGVIQGNPASSSYTAVSLASQTMEVQFSGATIQTRLTNSNQFNFNWSITQLL